jgi:Uma2 family endonuclease
VAEYWIVDGETRTIRVIRREREDTLATDTVTWHAEGAAEPLMIDVRAMFREALGD